MGREHRSVPNSAEPAYLIRPNTAAVRLGIHFGRVQNGTPGTSPPGCDEGHIHILPASIAPPRWPAHRVVPIDPAFNPPVAHQARKHRRRLPAAIRSRRTGLPAWKALHVAQANDDTVQPQRVPIDHGHLAWCGHDHPGLGGHLAEQLARKPDADQGSARRDTNERHNRRAQQPARRGRPATGAKNAAGAVDGQENAPQTVGRPRCLTRGDGGVQAAHHSQKGAARRNFAQLLAMASRAWVLRAAAKP